MILQENDLPGGFLPYKKSEMTISDLGLFGLDNGWKKGYEVYPQNPFHYN
jgi:hypothetical protein